MPAHSTPNRIRKIPLHRKIKYLINDEEWAEFMADHYFKKLHAEGKDLWIDDCWEYNRVVEASDLTLEEFLDKDWR